MADIPDSVKQEATLAAMGAKNELNQNTLQGKDMEGEKAHAFDYAAHNPMPEPMPAPTPTPEPDRG